MLSRIYIFHLVAVIILTFSLPLFSQSSSIDSLIRIYNKDNQNPENIIKIGEAYAAEKKWELAIDFYEKLVKIEPNNSDYLYRLGGTQAAYSEDVSKFKVLSLINTAKRNLIKSASFDSQHIESRWALVQILIELPKILGGDSKSALNYADEIYNISKIHGLFAYHYIYDYQKNENLSKEYEIKIFREIQSSPVFFEFNHFNFIVGKILLGKDIAQYKMAESYLNKYLSHYSSADRISTELVNYYIEFCKLNMQK